MDSKGAEWGDQGSDTSNLRSTFESKMPSWDQSGDGVVDADDLLAAFDTDGDGTFDKSEIAQIAKQLNEQTELNSALLEQLTELEVSWTHVASWPSISFRTHAPCSLPRLI